MARLAQIAFVLWGYYCDETVAAIFVTELRKAGIPVKLVGISGPRVTGAHGLTLLPDLMLSAALPFLPQVSAVVLPCAGPHLRRFANDPALGQLIRQALANQAWLVAGEALAADLLLRLGLSAAEVGAARLVQYPPGAALLAFAQQLAQDLR